MHHVSLKALPAALALMLASGAALADEEGFHGYFRVGAGTSTSNSHGPQSCYGLGGNTMKYRLGNECDSYVEGGYTKEIANSDGVSYVATVWLDAYSPHSEFGNAKVGINKAYIEAKGLGLLNGGTAWIGKRYYYRPDIHMIDMQYINMNGTGAGLDKIAAGPGKFSYAFFKDNDINVIDAAGKADTTAATRQNFIYGDIPVNSGGAIDVAASIITAQGSDKPGSVKHDGWQLSAFHKQAKVFGGENTVGVQYGVGPGVGTDGGRIGPSGSTLLGSDARRQRVFDRLWIQPVWNFGMEFIALAQRDQSDAAGKSTWTTIGARPVYALNQNLKLALELGTERVKPAAGPALRLTKLTFAPSISAGPGLWSRPELRAFVTYGKWNDAARGALNASNNSGPVYNNGNSGTSFGFQAESWF
ncbi:MAG: carbohydrate porin [Pseudomonadota bacterium]